MGGAESAQAVRTSPHDSFDIANRENWLVNSAGLGVYVHGRVHQEFRGQIFVGDLIHKRGPLATDDILSMEEQVLASTAPPLSVSSRMGRLRALAALPSMNTAYGEGELIGYYDGGVVSFNTHLAPRESRYDAEGNRLTEGWDSKRLVNQLLNSISATGRYAVAVLPRDHFFRSSFGLHFLRASLGEGVYNDEAVATVSADIEPLLSADDTGLLSGAACGHWLFGHRMLATTGMTSNERLSSAPFGRGFVSFNQQVSVTESGTPLPRWEGLWVPDHEVVGIHRFLDLGVRPSVGSFGFVSSDRDGSILFAALDESLEDDWRDNAAVPIEWSFETGRFHFSGLDRSKELNDGMLEGVFASPETRVRVFLRTDRKPEWTRWKELTPCAQPASPGQGLLVSESLGKPPREVREATWYQVRVEGIGAATINVLSLDYSESTVKTGRRQCSVVKAVERDPFETNSAPPGERWN